MFSDMINLPRLLLAALAAGAWVVASGMLMAASFGYRDMKAAFDVIALPIPAGAGSLVLHTAVRLVIGTAIAALFAILLRVLSSTQAMIASAGFTWLLAILLPYAVIASWGLFSWSLTAKLWAWGAMEMLIAGIIVRLIYPS